MHDGVFLCCFAETPGEVNVTFADATSANLGSTNNLNRMTGSPKLDGVGSLSSWTYSNDILGNRTNRNYSTNDASSAYSSWDVLNRMLVYARPSSGASYSYRADGQRIEKVDGPTLQWTQWTRTSGSYDMNYATNRPTSRYFYDGQMGFEDDYNPSGTVTKVNRYALGARGIDRIERYADSATTYGYPLYDGHGNIRTTLAKSGSSYTTGTFKTYDVWGSVRSGGDSSDPKQKYCGSLGHVADDESSLTYMRARYYEPATGRFVSEDTAKDGHNWYAYCDNRPVSLIDPSGNDAVLTMVATIQWFLGGAAFVEGIMALAKAKSITNLIWQRVYIKEAKESFKWAVRSFSLALVEGGGHGSAAAIHMMMIAFGDGMIETIVEGMHKSSGHGRLAVTVVGLYGMIVLGYIISSYVEEH